MTLRETTDILKEFCANEPNVGYVGVGDVYELNANQDVRYPAMVITQQTHTMVIDEEWYRFHFILFYIDRLTEDKSNENQVQSIAISVLKNLVNNLEEMGVFAQYDYTFNTFTERFESLCAGAYCDIQLNVPVEDCDWKTVFEYLKDLFKKEVDDKQDKLISGFNIKTINGNTLLGGGDLLLDIPDEIEIMEGDYIKITRSRGRAIDAPIRNEISVVELPEMIEDNTTNIVRLDDVKADKTAVTESVTALTETVDNLSSEVEKKATQDDIDNAIDNQKFKTINGNEIVGEGNIEIKSEGTYTEGEYIKIENGVISVTGLTNYDDTSITSRVTALEGSVNELEKDIISIEDEVNSLDGNKANKSDLEALETTVSGIDDKVTTLDEKVSEIEEKGYLTKDDADGYYQPIGDYATKDEIPTDYVDNGTYNSYTAETAQKIAEIEAKGYDDTEVRELISNNTSEINTLKGSVTALTENVEQLSSKVNESVSESEFNTFKDTVNSALEDKADVSDLDMFYDTSEVDDLLATKADKSEIPTDYATESDITTAINNQKFKTINGNVIIGEGNIEITGTTPSGNYLPLSGGTLSGKIQIGDATSNIANAILHIRKVTSSVTGKLVNGACYSVNGDGTASLQHKTYNDDGSGAKNSAVLRLSNQGIQFAINTGAGSTPTEDMYHELATQKWVEDKGYLTQHQDLTPITNRLTKIEETLQGVDEFLQSL